MIDLPAYVLHYSPGSCPLAAHILLRELSVPFELTLTSSMDGSVRMPAYLALNPKGRVPLLVLPDGQLLTELPAILLTLVMRHPEAGWTPQTDSDWMRTWEWLNWLSGTVHAQAVGQVWRPERFSDEAAHYPAIRRKGMALLLSCHDQIEAHLANAPWAVGNRIGVVDLFLLVIYRWGHRMELPMRQRTPHWTHHVERLLERPAVLMALSTEGVSIWH